VNSFSRPDRGARLDRTRGRILSGTPWSRRTPATVLAVRHGQLVLDSAVVDDEDAIKLMTPLTYRILNFLKRTEREDYFDRDTDFNPFRLDTVRP
jgi:hypothetical protein